MRQVRHQVPKGRSCGTLQALNPRRHGKDVLGQQWRNRVPHLAKLRCTGALERVVRREALQDSRLLDRDAHGVDGELRLTFVAVLVSRAAYSWAIGYVYTYDYVAKLIREDRKANPGEYAPASA